MHESIVVDSQNPSLILQRYFDVYFLLTIIRRGASAVPDAPGAGAGRRESVGAAFRTICGTRRGRGGRSVPRAQPELREDDPERRHLHVAVRRDQEPGLYEASALVART